MKRLKYTISDIFEARANLLALDTSAAATRIVKMRVLVVTGTGVSTESGPDLARQGRSVDPNVATDLAPIDSASPGLSLSRLP
jgi:hypothetical protein